jgi:hypothetical protein
MSWKSARTSAPRWMRSGWTGGRLVLCSVSSGSRTLKLTISMGTSVDAFWKAQVAASGGISLDLRYPIMRQLFILVSIEALMR